jgi:hypothetical protein
LTFFFFIKQRKHLWRLTPVDLSLFSQFCIQYSFIFINVSRMRGRHLSSPFGIFLALVQPAGGTATPAHAGITAATINRASGGAVCDTGSSMKLNSLKAAPAALILLPATA